MSVTHHPPAGFKGEFERLVQENLHSVQLDNTFLASKLFMSEARLYRLVKQHYELSPNVFIRNARLRAAFELLASGTCDTVNDAAFEVGFVHVGYFIRRFEEYRGQTPGCVLRKSEEEKSETNLK